MALNKFENDIKEKLDKRVIKPSEGSWDKLSGRLDMEQGDGSNHRLIWIGIAASIIGVLLITSQFFNAKPETKNIPTVASTPDDKVKIETSTSENEVEEEIFIAVENSNPITAPAESSEGLDKSKLIPEKTVQVPIEIAQEPSVNSSKQEVDIVQPKNMETLTFEKEKAQEVAEAIFNLSETESGVSNEDIDALLKQAQRDILLNRMKDEEQVLVDAALLLQEVEFELDQSFREKVFKALKESYGSVKTAIAHRND